jgi:sulfite reductase (NADPH) hemoprotein beta-component
MLTQRDHGDRTNRKHARFKYTVLDRGLASITAEIEQRSGITFQPARPFEFTTIEDPHGWHSGTDGTFFYGQHILSGRIKDLDQWRLKSALREIAKVHRGDFRLTPSQNLIISGASEASKVEITQILVEHGLAHDNQRSRLRLNALSCVALPTCGLALAESERVLPEILRRFEEVLERSGLRDDAISLRVTGCPNGCARPFLGEIALVGKSPGKYAVYLGAKYDGTRLNRLFAASATLDQAMALLTPVIQRYAVERLPGQGFGDFCQEVILPADATVHDVGGKPAS